MNKRQLTLSAIAVILSLALSALATASASQEAQNGPDGKANYLAESQSFEDSIDWEAWQRFENAFTCPTDPHDFGNAPTKSGTYNNAMGLGKSEWINTLHRLDTDRDGYLTPGEASKDNLIRLMFNDIDANRDGLVSLIEAARFVVRVTMESYLDLFFAMDIDSNGTVTPMEMLIHGTFNTAIFFPNIGIIMDDMATPEDKANAIAPLDFDQFIRIVMEQMQVDLDYLFSKQAANDFYANHPKPALH